MDLCSGRDLWERMPYTEEQAAGIIRQLVSAIDHMHKNEIVHRDIKMENILFESTDPNAKIKVIDFGLSKKFIGPSEHMSEQIGSFYT